MMYFLLKQEVEAGHIQWLIPLKKKRKRPLNLSCVTVMNSLLSRQLQVEVGGGDSYFKKASDWTEIRVVQDESSIFFSVICFPGRLT